MEPVKCSVTTKKYCKVIFLHKLNRVADGLAKQALNVELALMAPTYLWL